MVLKFYQIVGFMLLGPLIWFSVLQADNKFNQVKGWKEKSERIQTESAKKISQEEMERISSRLQQRFNISEKAPANEPAKSGALKQLIEKRNGQPLINLDLSVAAKARKTSGWNVSWNRNNGTPAYITGEFLNREQKEILPEAVSARETAISFLESNREIFKLENPREELKMAYEGLDELGLQHLKFEQYYQDIPVWGQDVVVHMKTDGEIYAVNGRYIPSPVEFDLLHANVSAEHAVKLSEADLSAAVKIEELSSAAKKLLEYSEPQASQYIWVHPQTQQPHLIWHVLIRPNFRDEWYYFVDAITGEILEKYNNTRFDGPATAQATDLNGQAQTIHVYQIGSDYFMIDASRPIFNPAGSLPDDPKGALWTIDARNTDLKDLYHVTSSNNSWTDASSVSAHSNVAQVFEYFYATHNRQAIDGKGSTIISVIHVTDGGQPMDNAYWNSKVMAYGDGAQAFTPLAGGLDVAAHEMAHGVTEHTVNLEYKFQSGALNESFSDVFGAMVDNEDWQIGEDVVKTNYFPSGAMRDMQDPHNGGSSINDNGWQPAHMSEYLDLTIDQDNGGVHINSGIPNRACYLVANAIGRAKTEQIYYRILNARYLNSQSNFVDMRAAAIQSATDLYGAGSAEVNAVISAFDGVGISDSGGSKPDPDLPPVDGEESIAAIATGDLSLYLISPDANEIGQLTATSLFTDTGNPISVVDDGSDLLFIDSDNFIRAIYPDGTGEATISSDGVWKSISISPDGTKLAATTIYQDSTLFIFDFVNSNNSKAVKLYNPTTQAGVGSETTLFADALDWDLSSQFIIFDAFNSIPQAGGASIDFWTITLLDVANEIIYPIFPPQEEGISLGNPSVAQTNSDFFVFDYVDFNQGFDEIYAVDLYTGNVGFIVDNNASIGYPRYSPDDSKLVFEREDQSTPLLWQIPLNSDKISAAGTEQAFIQNGIRPSWFAVGSRPTNIEDDQKNLPAGFALYQNFPNPFNPGTTIQYDIPFQSRVKLAIYDITGRMVKVVDQGMKTVGQHSVSWDGRNEAGEMVSSGIYFYKLEARAENREPLIQSRKLVLMK